MENMNFKTKMYSEALEFSKDDVLDDNILNFFNIHL